MLNRSDMKRIIIARVLNTVITVLLLFSLASCSQIEEKSTFDEKMPVVEQPSFSRVSTLDESNTIGIETNPVLETVEAATEAPTEYVFRWVRSNPYDTYDSIGFVSVSDVIPDCVLDVRYYSDNNFVGERIDGYEEPIALLSEEAAYALKNAANDLREKGYRLIIYDAYRPQSAVDNFASWANDWYDTRMKEVFYPNVDKSLLFDYGYIAYNSGHSRGSKVDLSLVDISTEKEVDMGSGFDYFDYSSHPDYTGVSNEQYANRMILREAMLNNGFSPCETEWWDFTLINEPYPYTYFNLPVSSDSLCY